MQELLKIILNYNLFIPHWHCYLWQPKLVGLHLISDVVIAIAYLVISLTLIYFVRKRQDVPFNWIFLLFSAFIVACGTIHLMEVWTIWHSTYWLSGLIKAITAAVSLYTAVMLLFLLPKALALPSVAVANQKLEAEIDKRLNLVLQAADIGNWEWNIQTGEIYWSASLERMFGMTPGTFNGQYETIVAMIHSDDREWVSQAIYRAVYEREDYKIEFRFIKPNGTIRWAFSRGRVSYDQMGNPIQMIGFDLDITERKQAEAALQESEARFQAFMNNSPAASWISDENSRALYVSQTYLRTFQLDAEHIEDVIGKTAFDLYSAEIAQPIVDNIRLVVETQQVLETVEQGPRPDGTMGSFLVYKFPLQATSGQCLVGGVAVDITERLQVERALHKLNQELEARVEQRTAALQESEERWQLALRGSNDGIWDWSVKTNQIFLSTRWKEMRGFAEDEINDFVCKEWLNQIHPDDRDRVLTALNNHLARKTPLFREEYRVQRKDGSYLWILDRGQALWDEAGNVIRMAGSESDISDAYRQASQRKQIEQSLRESEARYRAIVEDQTELITRFLPDATLVFVNEAYCRYFGLQREEIIGKSYKPMIFEEDRETVAQLVQSMSAENPTVTIENRVVIKGEIRWTQWINRMLFDERGQFVELQAVGRDITELKRIEATLKQYERIVSSTNDGIVLLDRNYTYRIANQAYLTWCNKSNSEVVGHSVKDILGSELFDSFIKPRLDRCLAGETVQYEKWFDYPNLIPQFLSVSYVPYLDADQTIAGVVVSLRDISNLQQTEEALRISEERLKLALEGSGDGLWDWNLVTGEVYFNANWLEMLGYAEKELPHHHSTWERLVHPDDQPWVMEMLNAHLKDSSAPYTFDYRVLTKSGEWKWIANYGKVVARNEKGAPLRMVGTHKDITIRRETEEQLRTLSQRLTLALKSGRFGIWEYDFVQNQQIWDDRMYELYGTTPDNFVNTLDAWLNCLHPDDRDAVLETTQQIVHEDKDYNTEFRIVQPSGEIRFLKTYGILQRDDRGNPVCIVGVNFDITNRKLAEQELVRNRDLREAIFNESADALFLVDPDTQLILDCNQRAVQLFETIDKIELIGIEGSTLHRQPFSADELAESVAQFRSQGFWTREIEYVTRKGNSFWGSIAAKSITVAERTRTLVRITDISKRKLVEDSLKESERRFATLAEASPVGIFRFDAEGNCVYVNNRWSAMTGRSAEEGLGMGWVQTLHPEDIDRTLLKWSQWSQSWKTEGLFQNEARILRPDGSIIWYYCQMLPEIDSDGSISGYVGIVADINDRKQAQDALAKYAREVEDLYNNAPCGYHSLDAEGRFVKINQTELNWLGYTREEMIGKFFTDFVTQADQSVFEQNYPRFKERGWVKDLEYNMVCKDGTVLPMSLNATAVKDADGTYLYNRATLFDIRERKRAQQELQELNTAMQNAIEGISRLDADGRYISVNRAYAHMCGYEPEELVGQLWQQTVYSDDLPDMFASFQQMLQTGKVETETRGIRKDGSIFYKQVTMVAIHDEQGNVAGNHCFMKDISERKKTEEIIKKQAQRELLLRVITQRVRQSLDLDAILTTAAAEVRRTFQTERALIFRLLPDGKGQVIKEAVLPPYPLLGEGSWIDRCLHPDNIQKYYITGQPRIVADVALDEWGDCIGTFLHQIGVRSKISAPIIQSLENGSTQIWGILIVHACGTYRQWLPEEAELLQQISNQLAIAIQQADLYQRVQTELAERKLAEEQLRQTNEQLANTNIELARATRLKDEFLANMSHELRTPLNAILGMSEGLQEAVFGSINERQLKAIGTIERSGRHLLELINDILDLSKIESGKLELQISDVPVKSLCDASLGFIRQMAQNKNIHLSSRIPDKLGSVQADERRLRQLLINLLSNAVKFTPEGGAVRLEVRLEEAQTIPSSLLSSPHLCFCVIDTGIGIAPENRGKLFQAFVQIDSSLNRQYSGTGLGLALVERIATLHGGRVSVESEVGRGSRFTVRIPYHSNHEVAPMPIATPSPNRSVPVDNAQVLIIEDSISAADQIARYLSEYGMQPIIYPHGEGALEEVLRVQPSLVILDIILPNQSGWDVLTQLKTHPQTRYIPVLIVSVVDERSRGLAMGASDYLVKPITRAELEATLKNLQRPILPESTAIIVVSETAPELPLILLAEDNSANLDTISGYIESRGYRLIVATNGQQAIDLAKAQRPNLIVMDIQMPGVDGLEAIRHIRANGQTHVPIIALTALAMPADRTKCLEAGANEYLTKPIKLKQLVVTIQQLLLQTQGNL